ncbi:hypothetical protein ACLMJK_000126 [Lecanora helva]
MEPMSMVYEHQSALVTPNDYAIQKLLRETFPSTQIKIHQITPLSDHLHRMFTITLTNNTRFFLKLPPSTTTPILQYERNCLASEAAVLTLLSRDRFPSAHILHYDSQDRNLLNSPFLLTTYLPGSSYADIYPYLKQSQRSDIDQQLYTLRSRLSDLYISQTFGPAALVASGSGFSTWREAFNHMLERVLMDGEDITVNLPYIEIRDGLNRCGRCLDDVSEARLLIVGLGRRKEDVRIERATNDVVGLTGWSGALWGDIAFGDRSPSGTKVGVRELL